MTGYKLHVIPGVTLEGKTRGGGSESIEWVRNGPMKLVRNYTVYAPGIPTKSSPYNVYCTAPSQLSSNTYSDSTVQVMGNSALSMARPASPSVSLLTSAGELYTDGLPTVPDLIRWRTTLEQLKALGTYADLVRRGGRDYLAYNFAWSPLKAEIRRYYRQVVKSDEILQQALRASQNHSIRVGHSYPIDADTTTSLGTVSVVRWVDSYPAGGVVPGGVTATRLRKVWFEGKYLYFPPVSKSARDASRGFSNYAKNVLGLELTPEVLWNLTPWSWFSDWLTNTDTVMASVSDLLSDGMVPVEGFVMSHSRREAVKAQHTASSSWTPASCRVLAETKTRFMMVPYLGFGGTGSLTTRQSSILAALGISRK